MKKIILHLGAHTECGSDSRFYQLDNNYKVILIGKDIGVENFSPYGSVHGIIANPECTQFSTTDYSRDRDEEYGMEMVRHCLRIKDEASHNCGLMWWVMENPARGTLCNHIGKPIEKYQPWQYGSPWTKDTALWGEFVMPLKLITNRNDVKLNPDLYIRARDTMPSLALLHKSAINFLPEYEWCKNKILRDADLRSLCSQGFAEQFKKFNP